MSDEKRAGDDPFQATMRIDIPPDLQELADFSKPSELATRRRQVIRVQRPRNETGAPPSGLDFQELLQSIYDGVVITDLQGRIISANVRALQFLGWEKQIGRDNVIEIISGANESLVATICETLKNDRFVLIQACCIRKDASIFPAEISVNRLHLSGRDNLSFFIRDVTLRKIAEERLRTGYNAIQNAGSGIAIADIHANLEYCNPTILKMWGLDPAKSISSYNIRDFLCDAGRADEMISAVGRGESWGGEVEMRNSDGTCFFVQMSVASNLNSDGETVGMVLSLLDISNLKRAQQQLECYARELRDKNVQMEDDLNMARDIQQTFLPRQYPTYPHGAPPEESFVRFAHCYFPSGAVGGDFFDVLTISEHQVGVFICDVVGHGMRAALVVATTRGLIEQLAPVADDPGAFLTQLNQAYNCIFRQMNDRLFATAMYMVYDVNTGVMKYANAGHPPPFLLSRDSDTVEMIEFHGGAKGPALGLFENPVYQNDERKLNLGDMLVMYTDGLSEAENGSGDFYESGFLVSSLQRFIPLPLDQILNRLVADAQRFSGSVTFQDDVCLMGMEVSKIGG